MAPRSRKEIQDLLARAIDKMPLKTPPEKKKLVEESRLPLYIEMHNAYRKAISRGPSCLSDPTGEEEPVYSCHMGYVAELEILLERVFPEKPIYSGTDPFLLGAWRERTCLREQLISHINRAREVTYEEARSWLNNDEVETVWTP